MLDREFLLLVGKLLVVAVVRYCALVANPCAVVVVLPSTSQQTEKSSMDIDTIRALRQGPAARRHEALRRALGDEAFGL